ncbi:MAG: ABC transporter substrate-binding protein [Beutenbergiaceae bacterium]
MSAAALGTALLASCSTDTPSTETSSSDSAERAPVGDPITFWDMPWGTASYINMAQDLVESYEPADGNLPVEYQGVQWANFYQNFLTAIASGTNPAISTGGGFQAFGLAEEGAIHYADAVAEKLKDDYLPGILEYVTLDEGVAGLPWHAYYNVLYYRSSMLAEKGLAAPATWEDLSTICEAFKQDGMAAFVVGAGPGNDRGHQTIMSFIVNNGGGLFDDDGNLDVMYDRNIEAVDYFIEMASKGYIAREAINYTQDNLAQQFADRTGVIGFCPPNFAQQVGGDAVGDLIVASPLTGPHGDQGVIRFVNSVMMYKNNPSIPSTEAFAEWYIRNLEDVWRENLITGVPIQNSMLDLPEVQANTELVKIVEEYTPVARHYGSRKPSAFPALAKIDGSAAFFDFAQSCLSGDTDAQSALTKLQDDLAPIIG